MVTHTLEGERVFCQFLGHKNASNAACGTWKALRGRDARRQRAAPEQLKNVKSLFSTWQNVFCRITQGPEGSHGPSTATRARRTGSFIAGRIQYSWKFHRDMKVLQAHYKEVWYKIKGHVEHLYRYKHSWQNRIKVKISYIGRQIIDVQEVSLEWKEQSRSRDCTWQFTTSLIYMTWVNLNKSWSLLLDSTACLLRVWAQT